MDLTKDQQDAAIELAFKGATILDICDQIFVSTKQFYEYRLKDTHFGIAYARARNEGLDIRGESLIGITKQIPDVMKARLESDNIKWHLSKIKPSIYGDKIDVNVNATLSLSDALREAEGRLRPVRDLDSGAEGQHSGIPPELPQGATGFKPVLPILAAPIGEFSASDQCQNASIFAGKAAPSADRPLTQGDGAEVLHTGRIHTPAAKGAVSGTATKAARSKQRGANTHGQVKARLNPPIDDGSFWD